MLPCRADIIATRQHQTVRGLRDGGTPAATATTRKLSDQGPQRAGVANFTVPRNGGQAVVQPSGPLRASASTNDRLGPRDGRNGIGHPRVKKHQLPAGIPDATGPKPRTTTSHCRQPPQQHPEQQPRPAAGRCVASKTPLPGTKTARTCTHVAEDKNCCFGPGAAGGQASTRAILEYLEKATAIANTPPSRGQEGS